MRDRPELVLARHFFASLFDFGFLSDDGAESLKRALLGSLAVAVAIGLLLARVFMTKYGTLADGPAERYALELMADHAFLMAVQMWFVAGAVALVGHSLFPDRTDFRVLMAEPLSRSTIFAAKLAALLLFVGLIVAGTSLALLPLAALTMVGAIKIGSLVATAAAFVVASLVGCVFAALAVVAVHGLLVTFALQARALAFSGAVRSILVGALVLSLPLIARLPGTARAFGAGAWWLRWAPPAWFAGLERWLAGDERYAALAAEAAIATALVVIVSVASYVHLYQRFDRLLLQTASREGGRWSRSPVRWIGRAPIRHAIRRFVSLTIRRSVLHQGLVVGLLAGAGGFVLNGLLGASGWTMPVDMSRRSPLLLTILWAPMAMMFFAVPAVRLALSVPIELRSNWVFRMTEDAAGRAEVAAANVRIVLLLGVALPLALIGPVQGWVLGRAAAAIIVLEAFIGWVLVEWVMTEWSRIPFTCSYMPGKGFVPLTFVKAFAAYVFFTTGATLVLRISLAGPAAALVIASLAAAAAGALAIHRMRQAPVTPLLFDDELPVDINPLRLNAD